MKRDREPTTARVYLEGGPVIHLAGDGAFENAVCYLDEPESGTVQGTTTDGEKIAIAKRRVIDVVQPNPEPRIKIDPGTMWGKAITVRGTTADEYQMACEFDHSEEQRARCVSIVGEDLASEVLVVFEVPTGALMWVNPAQPGIDKLIKGAMLLIEAQAMYDAEYPDEPVKKLPVTELTDMLDKPMSVTEARDVAEAQIKGVEREERELTEAECLAASSALEQGDVPEAINIAGAEFVAGYLVGSVGSMVRFIGGEVGEILDPSTWTGSDDVEAGEDEVPVKSISGETAGVRNVRDIEIVRLVD